MSLKPQNKTTYYYLEDNVMLVNTGDWDKGRGDCLGRTALGWIAYKWYPLLQRLHDFYEVKENGKKYIQVYRTPDKLKDVSRDHVSYLLIAFAYAENEVHVKNLIGLLPWKLSERYSMTVDLWLWMKGLQNKWYSYLFTSLEFFQLLVGLPWNKLLLWLMGAKERHQKDWNIEIKWNRTNRQKALSKLIVPEYALHNLAWQMYVMKRKPFLCRKLALGMVGKYNYLLRDYQFR